jgi:hypothetical protein
MYVKHWTFIVSVVRKHKLHKQKAEGRPFEI